jgi:hypothetical protein
MPIPRSTVICAVIVIGFFGCVGCQSFTSSTAKGASTEVPTAHASPELELVRNGVFEEHNTTTVGKAFEGTFQDAKWSTFETPKGAIVVQFDGTVTAEVLKAAGFIWYAYHEPSATEKACIESSFGIIADCVEAASLPPVPVRFQFLISADKKTFKIGYVDQKVFGSRATEALDFIYH